MLLYRSVGTRSQTVSFSFEDAIHQFKRAAGTSEKESVFVIVLHVTARICRSKGIAVLSPIRRKSYTSMIRLGYVRARITSTFEYAAAARFVDK